MKKLDFRVYVFKDGKYIYYIEIWENACRYFSSIFAATMV